MDLPDKCDICSKHALWYIKVYIQNHVGILELHLRGYCCEHLPQSQNHRNDALPRYRVEKMIAVIEVMLS